MIFHCPGSHLDYRVPFDSNFFLLPGPTACQKRYPKRYSIDTLILKRYSHGSTLSPRGFPQVFVCAVMSIASHPQVACIEQEPIICTGRHQHRQLQFINLIYVSDLCISISYVHAPNTVKRYSELRKTMSHRAPAHILSFACRSY